MPFTRAFRLFPAFLMAACIVLAGSPTATAGPSSHRFDPELLEAINQSLAGSTITALGEQEFSLVVKGGVSLGAYESGVRWALLRLMKDLSEDPRANYRPRLVSAVGASAGAINGFLAGLFWCSESRPDAAIFDTMDDNILRNPWRDGGIDELLDEGSAQNPEDNAAFSRALLRDIQTGVKEQIESRRFRQGCEVAFGLALTRSNQVLSSVANVQVEQQRLVVPLRMRSIEGKTQNIRFRNEMFDPPNFKNPSADELRVRPFNASVIYLVGDDADSAPPGQFSGPPVLGADLELNAIFKAIKASSSFPVAFAPMKLNYCLFRPVNDKYADPAIYTQANTPDRVCPDNYRRLTSYFVDGGVFDNDPLELARRLSENCAAKKVNGTPCGNGQGNAGAASDNGARRYIKIDPGFRRSGNGKYGFVIPEYGQPGDSLEIGLHAGRRPASASDEDDPGYRDITVRRCRFDTQGEAWIDVSHSNKTLIRTGPTSEYYVGAIHTTKKRVAPDRSLDMAYPDTSIEVSPRERLLLTAVGYKEVYGEETQSRYATCADLNKIGKDESSSIQRLRKSVIGMVEDDPSGLSTQLGFVGGSVASARGYRLYDELMRNGWHDGSYGSELADSRPLLQPARLTPLVGDFLFAFGAFMDVRLRDFDYYAGIYDGVFSAAGFICNEKSNGSGNKLTPADLDRCRGQTAGQIYLHLCVGSNQKTPEHCRAQQPQANTVMRRLVAHEFCEESPYSKNCMPDEWQWIEQVQPSIPQLESKPEVAREVVELRAIGDALLESNRQVKYNGRSAFVRFVKMLAQDRERFSAENRDPVFRRMLEKSERPIATWYHPLSSVVLPKLLELETRDAEIRSGAGIEEAPLHSPIRTGLSLAAWALESVAEDPVGWQWNQTSVPHDADKHWLATLLPSEVAVDTRNGGGAVYWNPGMRWGNGYGIDMRIAPWLRQRFANETIEFSEVSAFVTLRPRGQFFTSIGIGPTYSFTWHSPRSAQEHNVGVSASLGLLSDKIRVVYGVRGFGDNQFAGDEVYWQLGINDLPGLAYWLRQGW